MRSVLQMIEQRAKQTKSYEKQQKMETNSTEPAGHDSKFESKERYFEELVKTRAKKRYTTTVDDIIHRKQGAQAPPAKKIIIDFIDPLRAHLKQKQHDVLAGKSDEYPKKIFTAISADKMAVLTTHEVFSAVLMEKV